MCDVMRAPFCPERLLGDLDDDLLAFLQQFGDGRQRRSLRAADRFAAPVAGPAPRWGPVPRWILQRRWPRADALRRAWLLLVCLARWPPPRILRRMRRGMRCGNRPPCSRTCADSGGVAPDSGGSSPAAAASVSDGSASDSSAGSLSPSNPAASISSPGSSRNSRSRDPPRGGQYC